MEGDNPEPAVTNICPVFTIKQLAGTPVLVRTRTMEDPTPSNTLDHDALAESITTAYVEDELAKKIREQIKTANQLDSWMEREGRHSSTSGSMYRTRACYSYTPSATTMTTPQQDTLGRPRPWS